MPIYKGTNEVTSGNLYKGTTEIENGYKATSSFYVNELTWTFSIPSVMSSTSVTSNNLTTFTGAPGSAVTGQTFKILCNSGYAFQGGAGGVSISGLPTGMTASITASGYAGPGTNEVLVTLGGVYPQAGQNIAITATGGTVTAYYTATINLPGAWGSYVGTGTYDYTDSDSIPAPQGFPGFLNQTSYSTPTGSTTSSVWSGANSVSIQIESTILNYFTGQSSAGAAGYTVTSSVQGNPIYMTVTLTKNSGTFTSNETLSLSSYSANGAGYSLGSVTMSNQSCSNYSLNSAGNASITGLTYTVNTAASDPRSDWFSGTVTTETSTGWNWGMQQAWTASAGSNKSITMSNPYSRNSAWQGTNPYTGGYYIGLVGTGYTVSGGITCT